MNLRRPTRIRPVATSLAALLVAMLAAVGCTSGTPTASNAVPPPAAPEARVVYVALGADETLGRGLEGGIRRGWTQQVFAALPRSAVYVNLATEDAPVQSGLADQLPKALALNPTVVTIWFGSGDDPARTSDGEFTADLTQIVSQLRAAQVDVLLLSRVDPRAGSSSRYATLIQNVAETTGATFIDLPGVSANPRDPATQEAIAKAITSHL